MYYSMWIAGLAAALPVLAAAGNSAQRPEGGRKRVLILCTGNSARSQMAEGILRSLDPGLEVYSAGTSPAARVNPYAVRAMKEIGIDISAAQPKDVRRFVTESFDFVITVCGEADKTCPNFQGKVRKRAHIGFVDPAAAKGSDAEVLAVFRKVRDEIRSKFTDYYQNTIRQRP